MKDYLFDFEQFLREKKKCSANTLESYVRDVSQFVFYCSNNGITDVHKIDSSNVSNYAASLQKAKKANSTISRAVASIRNYFDFLINQKVISDNPAKDFKAAKKEVKFPEILTNKEVSLILSQPDGSDYKSCRDKAMLEVLYATGIKVSELIALKTGDINVEVGIICLHSPRGSRYMPLYPEALLALKSYLSIRDAIVGEEETVLFTNMNGQPLTRQGFWKIIKTYAAKANIKKDITPHTIRHSFAAHLLQNGAPLNDIKEMLGHADISSTQIYAQMMKSKYSQSYKRFHPLAK